MSLTQSHSILCNASQAAVYEIIRDSSRWPARFEPCIAVEHLEYNADFERIRISAHVCDMPMTWESLRRFNSQIFGIDSEVLKPMRLVKRMNTSWRVVAVNSSQCMLVLEHDYDIVDDVYGQVAGVTTQEQAEAFIAEAIDNNSRTELTNIRDVVNRISNTGDLLANRSTVHSIVCNVPASSVYEVIVDVANWPRIFDACVSAVEMSRSDNTAVVRIEAMQSGKLVSWETNRTYHDPIFRIDFHLPVPMPFMKYMNGQWRVVPIDAQRCVLHVTRNFGLLEKVDGIRDDVRTHAEAESLVTRFVEENAEAEMHAIRSFVESGDTTFSFFKTKYTLPYAPQDVYALLADVTRWPNMLPHCQDVEVLYDDAENQEFVMQVKTSRGIEKFRSIRSCRRDTFSISYFQPMPPAALKLHRGNWAVRATTEGSEIVAEHVVRIDPLRCHELFGENDLQRNKQRVKELISHNSKATVDACGAWLGQQRRSA